MRLVSASDLYLACVLALVSAVGSSGSTTAKERAAAGIGSLAYRLSSRKRQLGDERLAQAMPACSADERRAIIRGSFREFWRETFSLMLSRPERLALAGVEVEGMDLLRAAVGRGKGVILWESSYFGRRLMAKHILRERGCAVRQVHAENHIGGFRNARDGGSVVRQRILNRVFARHERRSVAGVIRIPESDSLAFTRVIWRSLREGAVVCTASDGTFGRKFISVPLLGHHQPFATGVISLARTSGAAILPMFCFDDPPGRPRLVIEPLVPIEPRQDRDRAMEDALTCYARVLESYVRRYPAQYRSWNSLGELDDS